MIPLFSLLTLFISTLIISSGRLLINDVLLLFISLIPFIIFSADFDIKEIVLVIFSGVDPFPELPHFYIRLDDGIEGETVSLDSFQRQRKMI